MTPEQEKALALARARLRLKGGSAPPPVQAEAVPSDGLHRTGPFTMPRAGETPRAVAQTASPPEPDVYNPDWLQYLVDTAAVGVNRVNRGISNLAGLPVDAMNNAPRMLNLLPGVEGVGPISDNPIGGGDSNYEALTLGGLIPTPEAKDPLQRIVGRIGEEIGAAIVPTAGLIGTGMRVGARGAREGNVLTRTFVEPAAVAPARFAGREAGAATAAGAGAGAANEAFDNEDRSNPWIDLGGAFGGVGLANAGNALVRAGSDIAAAIFGSERYAGEVVRNAVTDELVRNSSVLGNQVGSAPPGAPIDTDELVATIVRPSAAEEAIPGFQASTADRAGDAGLASLENARARNNPGAYRTRADVNSQAVEGKTATLSPQEPPGALRSALDTERSRVLSEAGNATADAQTAFETATAGLRPLMTGEARGADIRAALEGASAQAKALVSEAWGPVKNSTAEMNVAPLVDSFDKARGAVPKALAPLVPSASALPGRMATPPGPPVPTGVLDARGMPIKKPGAPSGEMQPVAEVMGIRSALTNELRRQGTTPQEARLIEDHIARLDAYVDQNMPVELRDQYDAARAATRDYHDRFSRPTTAIGQTLRKGEGGNYMQPDSSVPRKFVQGDQGRISDTDALFREVGTDARATNAVRDQILQDARDRGVLESPEAMDRFLASNAALLSRYPDLQSQLGNAAKLRTALTGAQKTETGLIERLTRPGRSVVASYLSFGDDRAVDAIKSVLGARSPADAADELLNFVSNAPKAVEGARAAFWRHMDSSVRARNAAAETDSGVMPILPRKMAAFLDDPANAAVAARLYRDNPEHLADIRELAEVLRGVALAPRVGAAVNPSGTAQMMRGQAPVTTAEFGSKLYQMQLGRVSPAYVVAHLAGKISAKAVGSQRAKAFEALLDRALLDPDTARKLLMENNPANRAALARSVNAWRLNHGDVLLDMLGGDDQVEDDDDELMRAITGGN